MKKLFGLLLLLSTAFTTLHAQDLVVTSKGDSIQGKVLRENVKFVLVKHVKKGWLVNDKVKRENVSSVQYNYFALVKGAADTVVVTPAPKLRLSISGGPSFRYARIHESIEGRERDLIKKLKWGQSFAIDATYYFSDEYGVGVKGSLFASSASLANYSVSVDGSGVTGTLTEKIQIAFVGPFFAQRNLSMNRRNAWFSNIGLGYLSFKDEGTIRNYEAELTGATLGLMGELGYEFALSDNFAGSVGLSYTMGSLSKVKLNGETIKLDKDSRENLGRFELTIGLIIRN